LERVIINYSTDNPLQSSDLLLVQKVVNDQNGKSKITPIISKYISYLNEDTVFCFFELYNPEKIKVNIEMELTQVSYAAEKAEDFWQSYRQQYQSYSQPWQILSYQKIYSKNIEMELPPATNPFILPVPINHRSGTFLLHYKIKSSSGKDSIIKYIRFNILPEGFPKITSIDDQIAVSKLAGKIGERNFFPDSLSNDDKYKKLEEFWSQTNTWNKEEFFKRAELANERFTTFIEGWKTPMGIVYIVCGEPDNTDNNRWVYQENVFFDFLVLRDKGKYEIETPMVTLQGYSSNAYNFWYRSIDRIR
jgi:GWxTD domain-containing protein